MLLTRLVQAAIAALALVASPVSAQQVLKVGSTPTGVPFTFLDTKTNSIQGIMVDLIAEIGKDAELGKRLRIILRLGFLPGDPQHPRRRATGPGVVFQHEDFAAFCIQLEVDDSLGRLPQAGQLDDRCAVVADAPGPPGIEVAADQTSGQFRQCGTVIKQSTHRRAVASSVT